MTTENENKMCVCDELTPLPHYGSQMQVEAINIKGGGFGYFTIGATMLWYVSPDLIIPKYMLDAALRDGELPELVSVGIYNQHPAMIFNCDYKDYTDYEAVN